MGERSYRNYDVLAVRYGYSDTLRSHCFYRYASYGEPDSAIRMDFFFWVVRDGSHTYLVDTGASAAAIAKRPGRTLLSSASDALVELDIDPATVSDVILTHLHYDHTGHVRQFPQARLHVQRREYEFWTGPYAAHPPQTSLAEADDLAYVSSCLETGAALLYEGEAEVAPGIHLIPVGGHTPGQSIVAIDNQARVILASDVVHYYEELERDRPFEAFSDLEQMYAGYELVRQLAGSPDTTVVAGHDPLVLERFPVVYRSAQGLTVVRASV